MKYFYSIYGLTIASDFRLEGALPVRDCSEWDVELGAGRIDEESFPDPQKERTFVGKKGECLLLPRVPDQIALLVSKERITIPLESGQKIPQSTQQRILGPAMAAVNYLRQRTILHASVIGDGHGNAVAFVGRSGAGKSTMASALQEHGGLLLSDDHAVIQMPDGNATGVNEGSNPVDSHKEPLVFPGVPQGKLSGDHPLAAGRESISKLENGKRLLAVANFEPSPCKLKAIYILRESTDESVFTNPVENEMERVIPLLRYRFRSGLIEELGLVSSQLDISKELSSVIPVFRFYRPFDLARIQEVSEFVMNHAFSKLLRSS